MTALTLFSPAQIGMAGDVPKEYYGNYVSNFDTKDFTTVTVGRGSSLQLDYQINEPGRIIR